MSARLPASRPAFLRRRYLLLALAVLILVVVCLAGFMALVPPSPYTPLAEQNPAKVTLLALGDQGSGDLQQWRVAEGMERVAENEGGLNMVLLLGDNFYGKALSGVDDPAWQLKFERVYHGRWLSHVPFYAVLGNHDYPDSAAVELDYARQRVGSTRWQMPAPFYTRDFGEVAGRPLLRAVFLDTSEDAAGRLRQADFLERAFSRPGAAPLWKMVVAHHAIRSSGGKHGDDTQLLQQLLPAMQRSGVDLYLSGHEHNQEVVVRPGEPAWLVSGGGGQSLDGLRSGAPAEDTLFAAEQHGFARLAFTAQGLRLTYYDPEGRREQGFLWARDCPWMAEGCLKPDDTAQLATNRATGQ
ncbi:metallophosphoesterase [Pseudomonas nitroreducens]|uniref:metallophosphoesterase n=1 Tax=Pseudomonas nitroreducens TaxID=46680 RepID=UPI00209F9107|nr:metallophosphoesterase [Pseudomonas nitroreducens]MCP1626857.1 acid phosphatase/tartrate-resistant acid phosphatase type 5 [Pseudomonas nitroreducens]